MLTKNVSKRGVSELAHSLPAFVNLKVLEIRENPGIGGLFLSFLSPPLLSFTRTCSALQRSRAESAALQQSQG
jgi:hypothetical protein